MSMESFVVPYETLERRILQIRGLKVLLDEDLAALYGVTTKRLNEQGKRNRERFPADFMLQLTPQEAALMRSQFATASRRNIGRQPFAFTEHGAIMVASILNSPRAFEASVWVVRTFVRMRQTLDTHKALAKKLGELETKVGDHDEDLKTLFEAMRQLMTPPQKKKNGHSQECGGASRGPSPARLFPRSVSEGRSHCIPG